MTSTEKVLGIAMAIIAVGMLVGSLAGKPAQGPKAAAEPIISEPTPEEIAAAEVKAAEQEIAAEEKRKRRVQLTRSADVAEALLGAMRDPDSTVFEGILTNEDASVVCVQYRSRNGFGGMDRGQAVAVKDTIQQSATLWKKHCTGDGLTRVR
ncbi:MAG: hypothetical protein E2576_11105 [Alcaligenaceae bacterium]|nr:hypothetical protein [Alcaligenaceae bacterium SAGV5]MPS51244.1 hypothetical protein [Alcaligenaceae bacterium SAGV3]MPT57259.1 hypothetical protein [Alcaligenaceae bacterium]